MAQSLTCQFDAGGAQAALQNIADEAQALVRPAAQSGAQVLYQEVVARVAAIGQITGNLRASIYQVYSRDHSTTDRATYHVSWNARKAPHGGLVEYGHIQTRKVYLGSDGKWHTSKEMLPQPKRVAARPFLRPAYDARAGQAVEAARVTFTEGMQRVLNGGAA